MDSVEKFLRARRAGVPIVAIASPDPMATITELSEEMNGETAIAVWDCMRGVQPVNDNGRNLQNDEVAGNPAEMLMSVAPGIPEESVLFCLGMDEWIDEPPVRQGIWNCRDPYKSTRRMLVLLGSGFTLPASLANDVIVIDEELPNEEELGEIVDMVDEAASEDLEERPRMDETTRNKVIDSIRGLPLGTAENIVAMNVLETGIDENAVWDSKVSQVEQTGGVSIWKGGETFSQIGGLWNLKDFCTRLINGKRPPKGIVFLDEVEKMFSGSSTSGGDSSGVSQGFLQQMLVYMQDHNVRGIIIIGPPGTGKSMIAKAMGNEAKAPTIALDMNGLKGSLVGESEKAMRNALKVVTSVTGDESFWVATCNSISSLPPELRRRFNKGTFFVDFPNEEERESIWQAYLSNRPDVEDDRPTDTGWTGAEIKECVENAWEMNISLKEASSYIAPVSVSGKDVIDRLRKECDGRYLSASTKGVYRMNPDTKPTRRVKVKD
jgi:nucleoside-triphosphatase THEP1